MSAVNVALDDMPGGLSESIVCVCAHLCGVGCVMCVSVVKVSLGPMSEVLCAGVFGCVAGCLMCLCVMCTWVCGKCISM